MKKARPRRGEERSQRVKNRENQANPSSNNHLLLLPQPPRSFQRNLQCLRHDSRRRQGQPLSHRNVNNAVTLVDLDPLESFVR